METTRAAGYDLARGPPPELPNRGGKKRSEAAEIKFENSLKIAVVVLATAGVLRGAGRPTLNR